MRVCVRVCTYMCVYISLSLPLSLRACVCVCVGENIQKNNSYIYIYINMGYIGLLTTSNLQGVAGPVPLAGGTTSRGAGRSTDTGLWPRLAGDERWSYDK